MQEIHSSLLLQSSFHSCVCVVITTPHHTHHDIIVVDALHNLLLQANDGQLLPCRLNLRGALQVNHAGGTSSSGSSTLSRRCLCCCCLLCLGLIKHICSSGNGRTNGNELDQVG